MRNKVSDMSYTCCCLYCCCCVTDQPWLEVGQTRRVWGEWGGFLAAALYCGSKPRLAPCWALRRKARQYQQPLGGGSQSPHEPGGNPSERRGLKWHMGPGCSCSIYDVRGPHSPHLSPASVLGPSEPLESTVALTAKVTDQLRLRTKLCTSLTWAAAELVCDCSLSLCVPQ